MKGLALKKQRRLGSKFWNGIEAPPNHSKTLILPAQGIHVFRMILTTEIISLNCINWLSLDKPNRSVSSQEETKFLYVSPINLSHIKLMILFVGPDSI